MYYFNILNHGERIEDKEGAELPDFDAAREEALASARDLVSEVVKAGHHPSDLVDGIEIVDADRRTLTVVPIAAVLNGKGAH